MELLGLSFVISKGTSRALVQPLERGYMRVWIGSLTTLLTRQALVVLFFGFPKKPSWDDDIESAYSLSLGTSHCQRDYLWPFPCEKRSFAQLCMPCGGKHFAHQSAWKRSFGFLKFAYLVRNIQQGRHLTWWVVSGKPSTWKSLSGAIITLESFFYSQGH